MQQSRRIAQINTLICAACILLVPGASSAVYTLISDAALCINSDYSVTFSDISKGSLCAYKCYETQRCRAFTTDGGSCQLFLFDKCSKSVKNCTCLSRGQVFVKQQPGLPPGALCPSGYTDDLCGVKYKMFATNELWGPSRARCEAESGDLVIMADVTDATEMDQVDMLYGKYAIGSFWLGGYQTPCSPEPSCGWSWVACNLPLDGTLLGKRRSRQWRLRNRQRSGKVEQPFETC